MTNRFNQFLIALAYCMLGLLPSIEVFAANAGTCQLVNAPVCVDGPSTKIISGQSVYRACWNYQSQYNCVSQTNTTDTCAPLLQRGCGQVGSTCVDYLPDGTTCDMYERTYQCQSAPGTTSTQTNCGGQVYCMNGNCTNTSHVPDQDFAKVVVGMEIVRETGTYLDPSTMTMFSGKSGHCRVTLSSFNCCRSDTHGSASSNSNIAAQLGMSVVQQVGSEAIKYVGSTYMYDALFANAPWLAQGLTAAGITSSSYSFSGPSLSYLGLTVGYGTPAAGSTVLASSAASAGGSSFYLAFNPVTFWIAIAILVYQYLSSCTQDEQALAMKSGQNLCTQVGRYCSNKILGTCVQTTQAFCCYNSELAKIIEVGAHQQLGLSWGSPQAPDCTGLTVAQIGAIDFSRIDFTAFIAHIEPSVKTSSYATGRATTMINNYFNRP